MGCTTFIVGKGATADGSVIVAHSDDDVADERVMYVEAKAVAGKTRPVYYDDASLGPKLVPGDPQHRKYNATALRRYVGKTRGQDYLRASEAEPFAESVPLGEIEQETVDQPRGQTFAYFDSNYGIMNEHQLMIGECTCGAKVHPEPKQGSRMMYSAELSRVALERCKTARSAIRHIGHLIDRYGYYGTGETLLIGDRNEAWVMEMCGLPDEWGGGLWVAQRVPDDQVFVAANQFRIRDVPLEQDWERMVHSDYLHETCAKLHWWDGQGNLDWVSTVSWGEYSHPYYSLRRVWRALSRVAPSLDLPAWIENGYTRAYPFSVKPEKKLSILDIASIYRDHYEGTQFDQTMGPAAGPFGDPNRYDVNPDQQGDTFNLNEYHPAGAWERPLSIYRCGMIWINQARDWGEKMDAVAGRSWIGLDCPSTNCLMPFHVGVTKLPDQMKTMNLLQLSRDSAYWAFAFVANYSHLKYKHMARDIQKVQGSLERKLQELVAAQEEEARRSPNPRELVTKNCQENVDLTLREWRALGDLLVTRYNNGCLTTDPDHVMEHIDYPRSWLAQVGYNTGPISYKE